MAGQASASGCLVEFPPHSPRLPCVRLYAPWRAGPRLPRRRWPRPASDHPARPPWNETTSAARGKRRERGSRILGSSHLVHPNVVPGVAWSRRMQRRTAGSLPL